MVYFVLKLITLGGLYRYQKLMSDQQLVVDKHVKKQQRKLMLQLKDKQKAGRIADEVSFRWKNPDFLIKNPDFLLKNPDFLGETAGQ